MKKEIQEEVKRISPGFPIREPAGKPAVPDGYFDRMQDEVMARLKPKREGRARILFLAHWQKIAAVVLAGLGIFLVARNNVRPDHKQLAVEGIDLTREEALDYALEHPEDFAPLLGDIDGEVFVDLLFPGSAIRDWDDAALEQVLDDLSDESFDEFL